MIIITISAKAVIQCGIELHKKLELLNVVVDTISCIEKNNLLLLIVVFFLLDFDKKTCGKLNGKIKKFYNNRLVLKYNF